MTKKRTAVISIQDLAEAYHATDHLAYLRLINDSGASKKLCSLLKTDNHSTRNVKSQEEMVEVIKNALMEVEDEIRRYESACKKAGDKVEDERKNLKALQEVLKAAETCLEVALTELKVQESCKSRAQNTKKVLEGELLQQTKKLEQMKQFTLVHPTATLSALDKRRDTVIVCTKFDVENMRFKKFADCVFDTDNDNFGEEDIPQDAREKFSSNLEFDSAIQYIKMVLSYWAEDKPYELLYNSEGIRYILDYILR